MSYSSLEVRRNKYQEKKDEINRKRREYSKKPEVKERISKEDKRWRENHKEILLVRNKNYSKQYRERMRELVFNHYGRRCVCCGEDNIKFLSIDHMDGNGRKHRIKINNHIHVWLVKNNFPKEFQVLCYNCNCGKRMNNGICPHKDIL